MRPKAADALSGAAAKKIRKAIRKVRKIKRLTNKKIAEGAGWGGDETGAKKVANALLPSHMLRSATARQILEALYNAQPRTSEAQSTIESAATWLQLAATVQLLGPRPAVLIPAAEVGSLAKLLAEVVAERTGARKAARERMQRDLLDALASTRAELAKNFVGVCIGRFAGTNAIDYKAVLTAFGYAGIHAKLFS